MEFNCITGRTMCLPVKLRIGRKTHFINLILTLISFLFAVELVAQTDEEKARILHYKALQQFDEGKVKKAISLVKKAINLCPETEFKLDLVSMYERQEEYRAAYREVISVKPKRGDSGKERVLLTAKKAMYSLSSLGLTKRAHELFGSAIKEYHRYGVIDKELLATLHNNYGVTKFFYQTQHSSKAHIKIHRSDMMKAQEHIAKAARLSPGDCFFNYNNAFTLDLINGIRWDTIKSVPPYPRPNDIQKIVFKDVDCPLPEKNFEERVQRKIIEYINSEKEIVFVLDISGSMEVITENGKSRFQVMKEIVVELLNNLGPNINVGLLTLGNSCDISPEIDIPTQNEYTREELIDIVNNLNLSGATPLNSRLNYATQLFSNKKKRNDKAIFLCSDGLDSCDDDNSTCQVARSIGEQNIKIYVFSLLLENEGSIGAYSIYDCMIKATEGKLLGLTKDGVENKTRFMDTPVFALPIKKEDFMAGRYNYPGFDFNQKVYIHSNNSE